MLARMGVIAFAWDMVGYADSTAIAHRAGFTDAEAELRLQSFLGPRCGTRCARSTSC